jgi:enamine deaminase RidA (YjgF/YER057c/UK114 family)
MSDEPGPDVTGSPAERLIELGVDISSPFPSFGTYVMAVRSGSQIVTAGHVPIGPDGLVVGKLGGSLSVEEGYQAARFAGISLLATLQAELGDLGRVRQFVNVLATVNAIPEFTQHTAVADGASDLFVAVFGDAGRHARLAVGVGSLPADMAIEVQATIDLHPG